MKRLLTVAGLFLLSTQMALAAGELPLVYDKENTAPDTKKPPLPAFADLPAISYLPDPFLMADGKRMTSKDQWPARRNEIKAILERAGATAV